MDNDLLYKIAITKIPKVGAVLAKNLIGHCGSARAVFEARKRELIKIPNIGEQIADNIVNQTVLEWAEKELLFLEKHTITPYFYADKDYPQRLKYFNDSPVMLFFKGNVNLNHYRTVAIVGTRTPSSYGKAICEELIEGLKPYNPIIVSGLAYGIDVAAHKKCLEVEVPTIGVLAHGLSRIYPPDHRSIAEKMLSCGGLVTEYPSDAQPDREHFPMRNRIIAGLSDAVIVVETATKGGSIITAEVANGYNRDVFAVPGKIKEKYSQGCHWLIKNNKAALIESATDIAANMRWEELDAQKTIQKQLFVELNEQEQQIVNLLQQNNDLSIDRLTYETDLNPSALASLLLELEFKGMIKTLPGKRFSLV